ncbi:MAG: long-chain fatty acid--CoA ligase [Syntrophaceae bacterium]|nr:long-chain fatty acid--CoA ligase [Syntrophaceae bacterium]
MLVVNISSLLIETAARRPKHPAIRFLDRTLTYEELNKQVDCLSHGLIRAGLRPKDVCVLMMPNSIDWAIVYYALAKVGAVVLPVNFLYRVGELGYIFKDSGARAFIGHKDYLEHPLQVMAHLPKMELRIAQGISHVQGLLPLEELFVDEGTFPTYPTQDDDTWAIIYTSGTTGHPKGAMLTHYNLANNAMTVANMRSTDPYDLVFGVLPLFHIYGQTSAFNSSIYLGLTIRLFPHFDAEELFSAIEEEESSILIAIPTIFNRLVELADVRPPRRSGLRFCISGGASLPVEVLRRFEDRFHTIIYEGYGLTECSPVCVENPFGRQTRPGSIGLPIPGFEARIVNDQDEDVPIGTVGELIIRGPGVMKGYFNQPEASAETLRGGWLHTGDLARMDEDRYIYIVDRKKEMIIRGGYNVYPREIEEILYTHPDVSEAAVVGIPHLDLGEEVGAMVVLRPGAHATPDELKQFVKERVAPYKYPRKIMLVKELPKSHTGKILKRAIRFED